jgi:hypothetical protein
VHGLDDLILLSVYATQSDLKINAISTKTSKAFFFPRGKTYPKIHMDSLRITSSKNNQKKNQKTRESTVSYFKVYHKATAIKQCAAGRRMAQMEWNRESKNKHLHTWSIDFSTGCQDLLLKERQILFNKYFWEN